MDNNATIVKISIDKLIPNKYQPRKYFDDTTLKELAKSIETYGIINPILVRQQGDKYEIIAGERRFRAAKINGLQEVPVIVKNADEQQMAELALIENLSRQDLTAIETARAYEEIIKMGNHTQSEIAARIGKSQATIANKIRLLSLPMEVQDAVLNKKISERHARCLLSLKDKEQQIELLNRIIQEKLTVKETEEIISIQNINEEDVKQAINDIMKSLNIKEEKEDEKMNNGNFFPNYDNNMGQNNNISLNSLNNMNPASAPAPAMPAEPEFVLPTQQNPMEQMPQEMPAPLMNNVPLQPTMPAGEELLFTQPQTPPQTEPMMDTPLFNPNMNPMPQEMPSSNDFSNMGQPTNFNPVEPMSFTMMPEAAPQDPIPNMYEQNVAPVVNQPEPMLNNPVVDPMASVMPTPQPVNFEAQNEQYYGTPITPQPVNETPIIDRLTEVQNLLTSNGVAYKLYSNNTGHCIIIEL